MLQLERLRQQYGEAQQLLSTSPLPLHQQQQLQLQQQDAVRGRGVPQFLQESPFDGGVARRVKRAYGSLDGFSVRLGLFLRRYPIARVFVLLYMGLLHAWVMLVLLTYTPEVHGPDHDPLPRMED